MSSNIVKEKPIITCSMDLNLQDHNIPEQKTVQNVASKSEYMYNFNRTSTGKHIYI